MSCPLEKFARVVGKCPVCLAEHEAGPSSLPGLIADWAEDDRPAPPDGVVSLPAPKPDELTVDDVLGALQPRIDHVHLGGPWHLERDWRTTETGDAWRLFSDEDQSACWSGTMREMWALAKRRGLLG